MSHKQTIYTISIQENAIRIAFNGSLLIQAIYPSGYKVRFENQLSWYNILVYGDLQVFTSFFFKFSLFTKALQMVHEVKYNFIFSI